MGSTRKQKWGNHKQKKKPTWMGWRAGRDPRHGGDRNAARCGEKNKVVDQSKSDHKINNNLK